MAGMRDEGTARRIEARRIGLGLTYAQLATRCGLSITYIHDVCNARAPLSVRAATIIAPIIGLDARDLLIAQLDAELEAAGVKTV